MLILSVRFVLNYVFKYLSGEETVPEARSSSPVFSLKEKRKSKSVKKGSASKSSSRGRSPARSSAAAAARSSIVDPDNASNILCYSPSDMKQLGKVRAASAADVSTAVRKARVAQEVWKESTWAQRRQLLRTILQFVVNHQQELVELSCTETGKTQLEAQLGEVMTTCEKIRWTIANCEACLSPEYRSVGLFMQWSARVEWHPRGVAGLLIPWNYPVHNAVSHVVAALASGNAAVVKPSEWSAWSAEYLSDMFHSCLEACNLPVDLITILPGFGDAGAALVGSADVVLFIGSPGVGRKVMSKAAETLTPVILELGGKDPFIVTETANMDHTVDNCLRGAFLNCGQNCIACERVYVYESVYDEFVEKIAERMDLMRQGHWRADGGVDVGAMVMEGQVEKVLEMIDEAVSQGAKVVRGAENRSKELNGQFLAPTLLIDCDHSMRIVNEETFGPVMTVIKVEGDDDDLCVSLANSTPYALSCSVYGTQNTRTRSIAKRILAGMNVINDFGVTYMIQALPFGGARLSGFGKFGGKEGLQSYCLQRTFVESRFGLINKVPGALRYPNAPNAHLLVQSIVSFAYGRGIWNRAKSLAEFLKMCVVGGAGAKEKEE